MALNIRKFLVGIGLVPKAAPTIDSAGELEVLQSDGRIYYNDGVSTKPLSTTDSSDVLSNKKLDASSVEFVDPSDNTKELKVDLSGATTGTSTTLDSFQTANRVLTLPDATDTLVGRATTDTLTNKTLTGNTAANLVSGSGTLVLNTTGTITVPNATDTLVGLATNDTLTNKTLTAPTVNNGSLNSIDTFSLDDTDSAFDLTVQSTSTLTAGRTLTIDVDDGNRTLELSGNAVITGNEVSGPGSATDNAVVRFDGTTGKLIQNSGVIVSDANAMSGLTQLDVDNLDLNGSTITQSANANFNILNSNATGGSGMVIQTANGDITVQSQGGVINLNGAIVDNAGNLDVGAHTIDAGNLQLDTNSIRSTNSNGDIDLSPNGTGKIVAGKRTQFLKSFETAELVDSSTTGSDQDVANPTNSYLKFTDPSLVSVRSFGAGQDGQQFKLTADTTASLILKNEDAGATAANRIITGTGADLTLADQSSVDLIYDVDSSRWRVVGGSGSGGGGAANYQISSSSGAFSHTGDTSYADVTNLIVTITTTGNPVELKLVPDGSAPASLTTTRSAAGTNTKLAFDRDNGTAVYEQDLTLSLAGSITAANLDLPPGSVTALDVVGAGTYVYKVKIKNNDNATAGYVSNCKLVAEEIAAGPNTGVSYSWTGYHDNSVNNWNFNTTSFTNPTSQDNNGNNVVEQDNNGFGTVNSLTNGGAANWPGIVFTPPVVGRYRISAVVQVTLSPSSGSFSIRLTDGTNELAATSISSISGNSNVGSMTLTGVSNITSLSLMTIKLQGSSTASGSISTIGNPVSGMIYWSIELI